VRQHPLPHELLLHSQWPPSQTLPVSHGGPPPQEHMPFAQLSTWSVRLLQSVQLDALAPQFSRPGTSQVLPLQQPAQLVQPAQTPPTQAPPSQSWQVPPPLPQSVELLAPLTQCSVLASQQPVQPARSQTQPVAPHF